MEILRDTEHDPYVYFAKLFTVPRREFAKKEYRGTSISIAEANAAVQRLKCGLSRRHPQQLWKEGFLPDGRAQFECQVDGEADCYLIQIEKVPKNNSDMIGRIVIAELDPQCRREIDWKKWEEFDSEVQTEIEERAMAKTAFSNAMIAKVVNDVQQNLHHPLRRALMMRLEYDSELRGELKDEIRESRWSELNQEVRSEMRENLTLMKKHERELREERKLEMRKDSTLRKKLEEDLKEEMRRIVYW